jgi:hypothetical protein
MWKANTLIESKAFAEVLQGRWGENPAPQATPTVCCFFPLTETPCPRPSRTWLSVKPLVSTRSLRMFCPTLRPLPPGLPRGLVAASAFAPARCRPSTRTQQQQGARTVQSIAHASWGPRTRHSPSVSRFPGLQPAGPAAGAALGLCMSH